MGRGFGEQKHFVVFFVHHSHPNVRRKARPTNLWSVRGESSAEHSEVYRHITMPVDDDLNPDPVFQREKGGSRRPLI